MKKILIIIYSEINRHPRVLKEIEALKDNYKVVCAGYGGENIKDIDFINVAPYFENRRDIFHLAYPPVFRKLFSIFIRFKLLILRRIFKLNPFEIPFGLAGRLKKENVSLIICHQLEALSLGFWLSDRKIPLILNAHEYYSLEYEDNPEWMRIQKPKVDRLCKKYFPRLSKLITVSESIAVKYNQEFDVSPTVITNSRRYYDLNPTAVDPKEIKLIHHGSANRSRDIELMIKVVELLPSNYRLHLMLFPLDTLYLNELKLKYKGNNKVIFNDIVPTDLIPNFINQYDIGLYILPPVSFNNQAALPNKFFEFVQARLAVAIGPSMEMMKYVKKYELGVVANDFEPETLAKEIALLTSEKILVFKQNAHKYAYELSWEKEKKVLLEIANGFIK